MSILSACDIVIRQNRTAEIDTPMEEVALISPLNYLDKVETAELVSNYGIDI